ncbi:MAG: hypothetical protein K2Y27_12920 [Xanthobacteraceae bacterium]|nr:hypothetical protein [Xanthobacteraceae bacterium]
MGTIRSAWIPAAFAIALCNASYAATITKVDSKDGKTRINLDGDIVVGDADKIREIIKSSNDAGRLVTTIRLNSAGGSLLESVRIAGILRYAKTATAVLDGAKCASACFIIFAAGSEKYAHYSAQLGVHGASEAGGRETVQSNAATISMAKVTKELGVPPAIIGKMVVTPPTQMVWLSVDELRSMGTSMIGKPSQVAPDSLVQPQLPPGPDTTPRAQSPRSIWPETSGTAATGSGWNEYTNRAIEVSRSQNNGKPRFVRTCQPELDTCTTGVLFKNKSGRDVLVKVSKSGTGELQRREVCAFNEFRDVRTCLDWDTGKKRRDMKNNSGKWYEVANE